MKEGNSKRPRTRPNLDTDRVNQEERASESSFAALCCLQNFLELVSMDVIR